MTILALPQLLSLILPIAVFIAVIYALNRMQSESEVAVLYGAGLSRQRLARPILQLATLAALAHLAINVVIQPAAFEERRKVFYALRTDQGIIHSYITVNHHLLRHLPSPVSCLLYQNPRNFLRLLRTQPYGFAGSVDLGIF